MSLISCCHAVPFFERTSLSMNFSTGELWILKKSGGLEFRSDFCFSPSTCQTLYDSDAHVMEFISSR